MIERTMDIATKDGGMETFICHPERGGPYPAVLFLMDAPGKRPLTNMCPLILKENDKPIMAVGASGGRRIMASVFQLMTYVADFGMTPEEAAHHPRLDVSGPDDVTADRRLGEEVIAALSADAPTEVVTAGVYPINFACPNLIVQRADGSRSGISDWVSPWSLAVAQ